MNKILSPKMDLIFKRIFGDANNKDILISFLQSILDIPEEEYDHIEIVDPNLRVEKDNDKLGILDLKLTTKNKNMIDIEIQLLELQEMPERIMFYTSKMITEQINKGESYSKIKKVISILILDYVMFKENEKYQHTFKLYDKENLEQFTDILEIHTLELKKVPKETDNSNLHNWLTFLKVKDKEELKMLSEKNEPLNKAVMILKELSEDEKTQLLYEAEEKRLRDEQSRLEGALRKGKAEGVKEGVQKGKIEGIKEGEIKGKIEMIKNLIESGFDLESISKASKISIEEIKKFIN